MANFSRDWNESVPTDNTFAVDIDDYNRYLRVDVSDRLKEMIYGFTAGENDGKPGFKKLTFKQQDSAPSSPNADEIVLYAIDDGSNCGLYAKNEDGYVKQILKKSGSSLLLNIGDSEGCVMKTGTQTIAGAKTFSDDVTLNGTNTLASLIASANLDIGDYTPGGWQGHRLYFWQLGRQECEYGVSSRIGWFRCCIQYGRFAYENLDR